MSYETLRTLFSEELVAGWQAAHPTYPLLFENYKSELPDGPWAHMLIDDSVHTARENIGSRSRWRRTGLLIISLYVPEETGTKTLNEMTSTIDAIFGEQSWTLSDGDVVVTKIPRTTDFGQHGIKEGYYERRLFIDYTRTECRP